MYNNFDIYTSKMRIFYSLRLGHGDLSKAQSPRLSAYQLGAGARLCASVMAI